jgi:hypothetical protein
MFSRCFRQVCIALLFGEPVLADDCQELGIQKYDGLTDDHAALSNRLRPLHRWYVHYIFLHEEKNC